jgi:vacuolar-type H+-ATPase subunit I/STV1
MDWLMTPLSGVAQHHIAPWAYWHARCMVLGWGVLLPLGALVARYFKVTPRQNWPEQLDNKAWWHGHRSLQWAGIFAMSLGMLLAFGNGSAASPAARLHAWAGWAVATLGWLQIAAGLHRGSKGGPTDVQLSGDHYDMTRHRVWFERLHKGLGWLALLAAVLVMVLGLLLADAPRWMAVLLGAWWLLLTALALHWQRQGRCIDTYQAIWGPDPRHPGNRLKPIGWGVRRRQS